jgi:hypothetical protein
MVGGECRIKWSRYVIMYYAIICMKRLKKSLEGAAMPGILLATFQL